MGRDGGSPSGHDKAWPSRVYAVALEKALRGGTADRRPATTERGPPGCTLLHWRRRYGEGRRIAVRPRQSVALQGVRCCIGEGAMGRDGGSPSGHDKAWPSRRCAAAWERRASLGQKENGFSNPLKHGQESPSQPVTRSIVGKCLTRSPRRGEWNTGRRRYGEGWRIAVRPRRSVALQKVRCSMGETHGFESKGERVFQPVEARTGKSVPLW